MKHFTLFKTWLLAVVMLLVGGSGSVWGADVTYTISEKNTFTTSGTAPTGSSATLVETYGTSKQMTSGNSQTITLSGYNGYKITSIKLSMRSNTSGGSGNFTYKIDGGSDQTIVATSAFNTASWNGSWSTSYVDITKSVDITCGATSTVLKISATANSLYCQSYTLTYEPLVPADPYTVSFNAGTGSYTGGNITETSGGAGITLPAATGCGDWTFAGWATAAVTETTTAPTPLLAGSTTYYPTANTTLYAVYSKTEGGGTTVSDLSASIVKSLPTMAYANTYTQDVDGKTWTFTGCYRQSNSADNIQMNSTATRYIETPDMGSDITSVTINVKRTATGNIGIYSTSGTLIKSISVGTTAKNYTETISGHSQIRIYNTATGVTNFYSVSITAGSSTITYNSTPTCSANPYISVTDVNLNFEAETGDSEAKDISITAENLEADISISITGDDKDEFSYSTKSGYDAREGGDITITYSPSAAGNHSATLTISSTGADDVEIALSGTAIPQLDWANLQWPGSGSITVGGAYVIYGQVYQPGLTTVEGNEADIQVWAGYNSTDTNPNTWTNWVEASFSGISGNNYEYKLDLGAEIATPGIYYYAFRYQLGTAEYVYGGYNYIENEKNGGFWGGDNVSGVLTVNRDASKDIGWGNVQWPLEGHIFIGEDFAVYGQVYKDNVTDQEDINENVKAWLGFTTDWTTNPADWDEGAWSAATFNEKKGSNYEFGFNIASAITSADEYYYVYRYQYEDGAYYYGGTDNKAWNEDDLNFGELTVDVLTAPVADQPTGNLFKQVEANWSKVAGVDGYTLSVYQKETAQDEVDHATNGSFEAWTETKPDGWFGSKSNTAQKDVVEYTESAQDGSKAVQLINATTTHKRFTTDVVTVQENTEYTIIFWARGKGDIRTGIFDGRSTGSGYSDYNDYVNVDSDEWVEYSQKVTATMTTSAAEFIFSLRNTVATNGHLQIDNVSITAIVDVTNILHVSGSPVNVTNADNENPNVQDLDPFVYTFTGLNRTTVYFYSVVAYKDALQSPISNEIMFTTGPLTDVEQTLSSKAIYTYNEQVFVHTTAGTSIEIFNVAGQKVSTTIAHDGLNIIPVTQKGVLVVKVGGMDVVKVVN